MTRSTFAQLTDRTHLKQLEHEILMMSFELEAEHGCDNMRMIYALVAAADRLAKRACTSIAMEESFSHYTIERCTQALGRIRATYS